MPLTYRLHEAAQEVQMFQTLQVFNIRHDADELLDVVLICEARVEYIEGTGVANTRLLRTLLG